MERDLNVRDKAGVPDAVLLEDFTNEDVFIENLEKRFGENIIYVSFIYFEFIDVVINRTAYENKTTFSSSTCSIHPCE